MAEYKILHLTLKKKWFDMILSGEKKEEYRDIKPFWESRIIDKNKDWRIGCMKPAGVFKAFDFIEFKNGYQNNAGTMLVECLGIGVGTGRSEWGWTEEFGRCFVIKLGDIKTFENIKYL